MPVAEDLLSVRFDTQMLAKLALSVAGVLLVSWAYRFYNSRRWHIRRDGPGSQRPNRMAARWEPDTEAPRAYLDAVEPDVAIKRGDENQNHDPSPPTVESMVQHDPPGIKLTPLTHDHSTQRASHPNCKEAEGRLDAELRPDSFPSPPPMEDLDQGGASLTERRSPCELGSQKLSTSMDWELRQDLSHLGNSSHSLSKEEVRMEGRDFLLERDGDAPVEAHGRIYDSHMESSLQLVSDESLLVGPSISNPIGELYEAAVSHDPEGLKEPEVSCDYSGTKAIRPLSPSFTPPLILRDLVLPSVEEHSGTASLDPPPPGRQGLVRKDSYMHIVENADLQIPFLNRKASTPMSTLSSLNPSSEDLSSKLPSPVKDPTILSGDISGVMGLEGVERLSILQIPTEGSSPELERLQGRLDLGNCLHALNLARKQGHASLQRAALKVMSDNYLQVLQDPRLFGSLRGGDRDLIQKLRTRGKRCLVAADLDPQDWAGSKSSLPKTSSSLYYYDDCKDGWHFLCPLPKEVVSRGSAMCVMDNYLFVTLGCQGSGRDVQPSRRVFCYNPTTSIWKELSPMNEARPQCKLVALEGCVYAIGGECLSSVERYDPRTGRWAFIAPMPNDTFAVAHRATACNGELFVSGGTLRYTMLRYNPATNAWRRSLIVGSKERTVEMVAVRNFLYRFDVGSTFGVSVYRYHVAARLWYECCSRKLPHCSAFQCAVMDDVIYCVSRRATMKFLADQVSPAFITEDLSILSAAKGILLPLILVLPETEALQTRV
ncbi:hypothetical protein SKAU_G00159150 [Synaphobranchus kaupii]|uniref:Kelch domain containing 7A n=1 Tax=Synaphobranchus kaupii TaxID=118154 RepID=A0A9Q1FIQ9_SYNKA|nr:hypothetical protein SKAU_G00159150 [Synaphobranchus kaupii]